MSEAQKTFGINGFGRIGRTSFRVWWQFHRDQLDLKVINTSGSMELEDWAHLVKYDSNYGVFSEPLTVVRQQNKNDVTDENPVLGTISLGGREIIVTAQRDPAKIPWGKNGVQTVIESTGVFTTEEKTALHLQGGAQQVILSAPGKGGAIQTSVIGVGSTAEVHSGIHSNASCTTNCVAPVAAVIHRVFGIKKATMTTVHAYTDDQNLHDNSHRDMRRARSAPQNIVPTSTGAAIAVTEVIPELKGMFDGIAMRVPVPTGSISDMVFVLSKKTTVEEVNKALTEASANNRWRGILAVTNEALVSSDIVGRRESSIVDLNLTQVIGGDLVKIVSWYDNEWGYCNRLVEQIGQTG
ncbi:MAG: type I glyceraldehyde-3-phosphate dehydrogenase [Pseudomonadales bacterium]|nr:type I glyceraldehyde-3-phosphate dehydrogenase [Pseudomonadales bacterium]